MAATLPKSPFRTDCLQGKVALVTGGGSGIGFEITRQLLLHGCQGVLICGRREAFLQEACNLLTAEIPNKAVAYSVCDVRNPQDCQAAVTKAQSHWGRLDILINGAAGNFLAPASDLSPKGFATIMAIDAIGTFTMCKAAYSLMRQRKTGVVRPAVSKDI